MARSEAQHEPLLLPQEEAFYGGPREDDHCDHPEDDVFCEHPDGVLCEHMEDLKYKYININI